MSNENRSEDEYYVMMRGIHPYPENREPFEYKDEVYTPNATISKKQEEELRKKYCIIKRKITKINR